MDERFSNQFEKKTQYKIKTIQVDSLFTIWEASQGRLSLPLSPLILSIDAYYEKHVRKNGFLIQVASPQERGEEPLLWWAG